MLARKRFAFYRILLGHKQRFAIAEIELARAVGVMIGKCVIHRGQTQARQVIEKALGIADAGHRVQLFARELGRRHALPRRGDAAENVAAQIHPICGLVHSGRRRVDHPRVDPARHRLAQGPRGQ